MIYRTCDKPYLEFCRELGWDDSTTQKYLDYRSKRSSTIRRGRTAYKDSTQNKVYRSESKYHREYGYGQRYKTIEECEKYVKRITKSKLWKDIANGKTISVSKNKCRRWAGRAWGSHIDLAPSGYNQYVILHELAHCSGNMHHDVSFRQDLVKLVSRFLGREQAKHLKQCFLSDGLKMTIKNTVKEPEVWLASYNKMAAMRRKLPSASQES